MGLWTLVKRTFLGDDREEKAEAERELAALRGASENNPPEPVGETPAQEPTRTDPRVLKQESEERLRRFTEIKSKLTIAQETIDALRNNGKRNGKAEPKASTS